MRPTSVILVAAAAIAGVLSLYGQDSGKEERAIRELIAKENQGHSVPLADDIAFVGTYPKAVIGLKQLVAARNSHHPLTNELLRTEVVRLVVARSGDMAYEFDRFHYKYHEGAHDHDFSGEQLRVWTKLGGQWHVSASFSRPDNDTQNHP
jgi:ketosteroid isomerase-like protein